MIHTSQAGECQSQSLGSKMIREEEDDTTQEIRQLVMFAVNAEVVKRIESIAELKVESTSEWTDGVNAGLDLAIKRLRKDKSIT